jgi:hypothetical protein
MVNDAECVWTAGTEDVLSHEIVVCSGEFVTQGICPHPDNPGTCNGPCRREIRLEFDYSGITEIIPPDTTNVRTRNVSWTSLSEDRDISRILIDIVDYFEGDDDCTASGVDETIGYGVLELEDEDAVSGEVWVAGIQYDLDADIGELPEWYLENEWHYMTYVVYPDSEEMPGRNDSACLPEAAECLIVENTGAPNNNKRALVIVSGIEINDQDRSSIENIEQYLDNYFENANSELEMPIELRTYSGGNPNHYYPDPFNDQIRIISETEVPDV